ncbi:tRNA lysidine(34) synthetase TilS [Brucellaceae bacterium C25G]
MMESICDQLKLEDEKAIIVAVSGGSDSICLLVLMADYLQALTAKQNVPRLVAVTVDHGLRAESAAEALSVAQFCADRHIEHHTKIWQGEKPESGISVAARQMRYHLLKEAAREAGACMIFTGHSEDDQVETYIMRHSRKKTTLDGAQDMRGLAGMAPFTLLDGRFLLVRPLLNMRRQQLRDHLKLRGIGWIDDPTNVDMHYERPRIRQTRKEHEHSAFVDLVACAAQKRRFINQQAVDYWQQNPALLSYGEPDIALLDKGLLAAMPYDAALVFIGFVLALAGGKNLLPRPEDCNLLLQQMVADRPVQSRMNYSGCIIDFGSGYHRIWREQRNLPLLILPANTKQLWDNRYWIENNTAETIEVRPTEQAAFHRFCKTHDLNRRDYFQPAVWSSPAIYVKNQLKALPALALFGDLEGEITVSKHYAMLDNVLTGHDFMLASCFYQHFKGDELNHVANICRKFHKNRL